MRVFWAKGYQATSISDLVAAMRINKGSLYNAFGSKQALFARAFLKYDRENRQASLRKLEAMDEPVLAIRTLFDSMIAESEADTERKGCLLVNTAVDLPNQSDEIQKLVKSAIEDLERFFRRLVEAARVRGEVRPDIDSSVVAKSLVGQVVCLRVLARGVFDVSGLEAIRSQALQRLGA
ncbi:MAG: helix-turn-helix transcriptional regulator [Hyphomicrobiales bacterium]|nr:helix-turn-helix transcriptional regulator [Hyphomicrobiales bacterium]